jgi:hypothetical protein
MSRIQLNIIVYPVVIFGFVFLNYSFLEELLIPDYCYYHSHDTNVVFDVFYNTSTASGGHPEPTLVNLITTLILGGILARVVIRALSKFDDAEST